MVIPLSYFVNYFLLLKGTFYVNIQIKGGDNVNVRVFELRKYLKMSQEAFGTKLGVRKTAISKIEKGENNLTEAMFKLICSEFNVNEEWLRTGNGEVFVDSDSSILNQLSKEYSLDTLDVKIIESFLKLSPEGRNEIKNYLKSISLGLTNLESNSINETNNLDDIEEEVERYRLELEAEKRAGTSGALENGKRKSKLG